MQGHDGSIRCGFAVQRVVEQIVDKSTATNRV